MADIARLEEVMGFIEAHPELHNQALWMHNNLTPQVANKMRERYPELDETECGSRGCLAGWTVHFWGDQKHTRQEATWHHDAANLLGLNISEADILFCSKNSREDLHQMVKDLANGLRLEDIWKEVTTIHIDEDGDRIRKYFYQRVGSDG
jgi:hypothetical protein